LPLLLGKSPYSFNDIVDQIQASLASRPVSLLCQCLASLTEKLSRWAGAGQAPSLANDFKARGIASCTRDSAVGLTQC